MVEVGGRPAAGIVAAPAIHLALLVPELSAVDVLVATRTLLRRVLEWNLPRASIRVGNAMAIQTSEDLVRARERVICHAVVEGFELPPGSEIVAGFAEILGTLALGRHAFWKVALMRILVAVLARLAGKME